MPALSSAASVIFRSPQLYSAARRPIASPRFLGGVREPVLATTNSRTGTTVKSMGDGNTGRSRVQELVQGDSTDGWQKCWEEGVTPWDLGKATPILEHLHRIGNIPKGRALVPGCGTGYDVAAIACLERFVVGLDISELALKNAVKISDHVGGPPYKVSVSAYEEVLLPLGFKAISIVDNELAVAPRKGREKLGRWKRVCSPSSL